MTASNKSDALDPQNVWISSLAPLLLESGLPAHVHTYAQRRPGFCGVRCRTKSLGRTPEKDLCHSLSQNIQLESVQKSNKTRVTFLRGF